mgnify:CR=1 FL=1
MTRSDKIAAILRQMAQEQAALFGVYVLLIYVALLIEETLLTLGRRAKRIREDYLSQFDADELRMNPYKVGVVYRLLSQEAGSTTAVRIWDDGDVAEDAEPRQFSKEGLMAFDPDRFYWGTRPRRARLISDRGPLSR